MEERQELPRKLEIVSEENVNLPTPSCIHISSIKLPYGETETLEQRYCPTCNQYFYRIKVLNNPFP